MGSLTLRDGLDLQEHAYGVRTSPGHLLTLLCVVSTSPEVLNWNGSELDGRPACITQQVQTYKATYEL